MAFLVGVAGGNERSGYSSDGRHECAWPRLGERVLARFVVGLTLTGSCGRREAIILEELEFKWDEE